MKQNGTENALTVQQESVITRLLMGETVSGAAQREDVSRATIYRWLESPPFVATLNRVRSEQQEATRARLQKLAGDALAVVENAVAAGDVKTALAVLRGTGFLHGTPPEPGPTDEAAIGAQVAQEGRQRALNRIIAGNAKPWGEGQ